MVRILNRDEFAMQKQVVLKKLRTSVFIYPTDTIYGIGCNALDEELVHKVRAIKKRHAMPFSVIAPSKEWIRHHCILPPEGEEWLDRLPGPYTLVLRLKDPESIPSAVNMGLDTLGIRIPDNWFSDVVAELGLPVVTTSANLTGEDHMTALENINPIIRKNMDIIFYVGELKGRPSTIVRLDTGSLELRER